MPDRSLCRLARLGADDTVDTLKLPVRNGLVLARLFQGEGSPVGRDVLLGGEATLDGVCPDVSGQTQIEVLLGDVSSC